MRIRLIASVLILLFGISIYNAPFTSAESQSEAELIYTIKNRDAILEDRKAALNELAKNPSDAFRQALIELLQNQQEIRLFQQYAAQISVSMSDTGFYNMLRKKLADKKTDAYLRQVSLSILWKKNPDLILPLVLSMAQDPFETFFFRSKIMQYLAIISKKKEVKEVMTNILKDPEESSQIKKLALNILGKGGDPKVIQNIYQDLALDRSRSIGEREGALKQLEAESPALLEDKLFKILNDKNEDPEMKKIAAQKISENEARVKAVLPKLKQLERMGPLAGIDNELREVLRNLVEETEKKILAEQLNQKN